jgi:hypothetical protein
MDLTSAEAHKPEYFKWTAKNILKNYEILLNPLCNKVMRYFISRRLFLRVSYDQGDQIGQFFTN